MEIDKLKINGVEYDIGLEKYLTFIKPAEIIEQKHQITLTVDELENWYKSEQPDYSYFTFTATNKKLLLFTSRGNSCPQNIVYVLDCIKAGLSKDDFMELSEQYGVNLSGSDEITIYYGD